MKFTHQLHFASCAFASAMLLTLLCASPGCRTKCGGPLSHPCDDIPPGAMPQPVGAFTCGWQETQAANAERDDFVVYQYEWINRSTALGPFGSRHLDRLIDRVTLSEGPIVIEESDDPHLDQQRRELVIQTLQNLGSQNADTKVVIGRSQAEGLSGQEAPALADSYLKTGSGGNGGRSGGVGGNSNSSGFGGGLGSGY